MVSVSDLNLPTLPVGGYTEFEFQVWWQEVVTRMQSAIDAININGAAADGSQEQVIALEMGLNSLRTLVRLLDGQTQEQFAALESRLAQLQAQDKKMAQAVENMELMAWLS